ncbi:MAG: hypothetical protein HY303_12610 [Candidatus Wallbacteria bacterium]|nr:hypothetical protein [Candidatus Wallbacteria bacterium]
MRVPAVVLECADGPELKACCEVSKLERFFFGVQRVVLDQRYVVITEPNLRYAAGRLITRAPALNQPLIPTYDTIWINGPPGSGKTTTIERLLESDRRQCFSLLRLRADEQPRRNSDEDPDVVRYKRAGALVATAARDTPGERVEALTRAERLFGSGEALIVEGHPRGTIGRSGLGVFVLRPMPEGQPLVTRGRKEAMRLDLATYLTLGSKGGSSAEEPPPPEDGEWETVEEIELPPDVAGKLLKLAKDGVPIMQDSYLLPEGHDGLHYASVYLINITSESERPRAEGLAEELRRLRADGEVLRDLPGWVPESRRISVYVGNALASRDPDIQKLMARIKRGVARGGGAEY